MEKPPSDRPFLSLEEVAEHLGVTYQLIYRLVRSGELPAVRVGRVYRVRREDLDGYLQRNATGADGGFTCGACGKTFHSKLSQKGTCPDTGLPICIDCWDRKGIRTCKKGDRE